jgi:hypothetical protein
MVYLLWREETITVNFYNHLKTFFAGRKPNLNEKRPRRGNQKKRSVTRNLIVCDTLLKMYTNIKNTIIQHKACQTSGHILI